jgi:magnesium-protoporphyrin IX monomethyl ester (oxidative) cyclase
VITLVLMPFSDIERPSLALGLLKAALTRDGQSADIIYANLLFAQRVGIHASSLPLRFWANSLIGEWVFASAAFPDFSPSDDRYLEECVVPFARLHTDGDPSPLVRALRRELRRMRAAAPAFINQLARDLLANRPKIVGCSSTFFQQLASLALLRRIRELDPDVVTVIGGANVEGAMGAAVVRTFPWVDVICSGEADETVVSLFRSVTELGRAGLEEPLPEGVVTRPMATHAASAVLAVQRATVSDLDALPVPDYDDYFRSLARLPDSNRLLIHPALPMETSRGCWWGDKHACTFCGLNRGRHAYRAKKPARAWAELEALATRYGVQDFVMVDNIVPPRYFASLFPRLERLQAPYNIFYEIRPCLRREHARQLSAAGVRHVQAGIESLHDSLLELMNKGSSVLQNVALLKHAREFGMTVGWHLLTGFPGDSDDWYGETAAWLPLVHHLQPPASLHGITLQRFSVYMKEPPRYGLEPVPYNSYDVIYPLPSSTVRELAYHFRDASWPEYYPEVNRETPGVRRLMAAVEAWRCACWNPSPPQVTVRELDAETLMVVDTRPCAVSREVTLRGLPAQVYRLADEPVDQATLSVRLAARGIRASSAALRDAVAEIVAARLALHHSNRVLSLATPEPCPRPLVSLPSRDTAEEAFRRYLSDISRQNEAAYPPYESWHGDE